MKNLKKSFNLSLDTSVNDTATPSSISTLGQKSDNTLPSLQIFSAVPAEMQIVPTPTQVHQVAPPLVPSPLIEVVEVQPQLESMSYMEAARAPVDTPLKLSFVENEMKWENITEADVKVEAPANGVTFEEPETIDPDLETIVELLPARFAKALSLKQKVVRNEWNRYVV